MPRRLPKGKIEDVCYELAAGLDTTRVSKRNHDSVR